MQFSIEIRDEVQTVSNEASMVHDYASGLHYAIVENGGFLRNGPGLSHQQWVHLTTLERGNLVASRVLGSAEYLRIVRQGYGAQRQADDTDEAMDDGDDREEERPAPADPITELDNLEGMIEHLDTEHLEALTRLTYLFVLFYIDYFECQNILAQGLTFAFWRSSANPMNGLDLNFTLHSWKATLFSWGPQLSMHSQPEQRLQQGHHVSQSSSLAVYSRDSVWGALDFQRQVISQVRHGANHALRLLSIEDLKDHCRNPQ